MSDPHDHSHSHHHGTGHTHAPANFDRAFAIGVALNTLYIAIEVTMGLTIHSMALLADAGHNLSDVLSLLLAWLASRLTRLPTSTRRTYGLRKSSILASLANALLLLIAIGAIAWEALQRLSTPQPLPGSTMMWVAGIGVVINTLTALLFMKGREHDINIRGAYLHMAADAGVSAGVVLAGLLISLTGAFWIDPVMSLLIVAVIAWGTWGLLRDSLDLAMDAVPAGIDPNAVRHYLARQHGVTEVHDLHIWAMSTTSTALTAHLVVPDRADADALLACIVAELREYFGIDHPTIQLEPSGGCAACDQEQRASQDLPAHAKTPPPDES